MELQGARVLLTGGSRGIGLGIAERLQVAGAKQVLVASNAALLNTVAARLDAKALPCDLSQLVQVEGLVERAEALLGGPIDVLINNAGLDETGLLTDKTAADVQRIHQVNLLTPIELCRQVLPAMKSRRHGHIVNVSSTAACGAFSGMSLYASTKAGLTNFSRVLRLELKGTGVGLTDVAIGPVPTDMLHTINENEHIRKSFARFRRLQLLPNISSDRVADAVIDAIRAERRHVWLPRRAALYPTLHEIPQQLINLLTFGIKAP
jgi:NAD(P)-dependent dehydrogenase (short-subunit alcohol dehydrogenase family)